MSYDEKENFENEGTDSMEKETLSNDTLKDEVISENTTEVNKPSENQSLMSTNPDEADVTMTFHQDEEEKIKITFNDMPGQDGKVETEMKDTESNISGIANSSDESKKDETSGVEEKPFSESPKREAYYHETVKKKSSNFKRVVAACAVVGILGGGGIGAGYSLTENFVVPALMGNDNSSKPTESTMADASTAIDISKGQKTSALLANFDAVSIIKNVEPSVVSITTKATIQSTNFFGYSQPYEASGAGSGVIFFEDDEKVYVATNAHVVEGATTIKVSVNEADGVSGVVVGTDTDSDLAVVSVLKSDLKTAGIESYKVAQFGNSDSLEVGENVIAIGNALGYGKTSTGGMISAKNKEVNVEGTKYTVIQTDAAINPGNSGGALVNSNGEVVGINSVKIASAGVEGMGYAIPSNVLTPIIQDLLKNGTAPRPYLGIVGTNVTEELGSLYKLPIGVLITETVPGGSADTAGIIAGDIITEFAGKKIMTMDKLIEALSNQKVGDKVNANIIRDGETQMEVTITIQDANAGK